MRGLMTYFTVKQKLWLLAGFVMLMLALVSVVALLDLHQAKIQTDRVVREIQPSLQAIWGVKSSLNQVNAHLGYYLKSGDEHFKRSFTASLEELTASLDRLRESRGLVYGDGLKDKVDWLRIQGQKIAGYRDRMLALGADSSLNLSAMVVMQQRVNPHVIQATQILSDMIEVEVQEDANAERRVLLTLLQKMRYHLIQAVSAGRGFIGLRVPVFKDNMELYLNELAKDIEQLKRLSGLMVFEQETSLPALIQAHEQYTQSMREMVRVHGSEQAFMDVYLLKTELGPLFVATMERVNAMAAELESIAKHFNQTMEQDIDTTETRILALVSAVFLGILLVVAWLSRDICGKLLQVVAVLHDIAQGDGDLSRKLTVEGEDETAQLAVEFNSFVEKIRETVCQVAQSVERLRGATRSLAEISQRTNQAMGKQQHEAEALTQSIADLSRSAGQMTQGAHDASTRAAGALTSAEGGRQVLHATVRSIQELGQKVESASEVINRLEQGSDDIGKVVDVIRGIAEQTNLLALNAAIEAARAGDQGRGFAVVADEVRTLAGRTQASTQEIQAMIQRLQDASSQAVAVMEAGREQAHHTMEQAEATQASFSEIIESVNTIDRMSGAISGHAATQNQVVLALDRNVQSIHRISQATGQDAETIAHSAAELTRLSEQLQVLVGSFKTG